MGSFNYTCAFSGLPIEAGDPVRIFLLAANPYNEANESRKWWVRTWPLKAEYDEYGSVENVQSEVQQSLWTESFRMDVIAKGWGDNKVHDVEVLKDMDFGHLLGAVQEGRVQIKTSRDLHNFTGFPERPHKSLTPLSEVGRKLDRRIPTIQRVKKILLKHGFELFTGHAKPGQFIVDSKKSYTIRIRVGSYGGGHAKELKPLAKILRKRFAVTLHPGTGSYAHDAELSVLPKVTARDLQGYPPRVGHKNKVYRMRVEQALVREDVWQILCGMKAEWDWSRSGHTLEQAREKVKEAWDILAVDGRELLQRLKSTPERYEGSHLSEMRSLLWSIKEHQNQVLWDEIPFAVGLGSQFHLMAKRYREETLSDEEASSFLEGVAEFIHVRQVLMSLRYLFRPSYGGAQSCEWKMQVKFLGALKKLVTDKRSEEIARERKDRAEMKAIEDAVE